MDYEDYAEQERQDELWRAQHPWQLILVRLGIVVFCSAFWIFVFKAVL